MRRNEEHIPHWVIEANDPQDPFVFVVACALMDPPFSGNRKGYTRACALEGTDMFTFLGEGGEALGVGFFDYKTVEATYNNRTCWENFLLVQYTVRNIGVRLSQLKRALNSESGLTDTLKTGLSLLLSSSEMVEAEVVIEHIAEMVAAYTLEAV